MGIFPSRLRTAQAPIVIGIIDASRGSSVPWLLHAVCYQLHFSPAVAFSLVAFSGYTSSCFACGEPGAGGEAEALAHLRWVLQSKKYDQHELPFSTPGVVLLVWS